MKKSAWNIIFIGLQLILGVISGILYMKYGHSKELDLNNSIFYFHLNINLLFIASTVCVGVANVILTKRLKSLQSALITLLLFGFLGFILYALILYAFTNINYGWYPILIFIPLILYVLGFNYGLNKK